MSRANGEEWVVVGFCGWVYVCVCVQVLTFSIVFISLEITHVHGYLIMYTYIYKNCVLPFVNEL